MNNEPKSQNLPLPQQSALMTPQRLHRDSLHPVRLRMLKRWAGGRWEDGPASSIFSLDLQSTSRFGHALSIAGREEPFGELSDADPAQPLDERSAWKIFARVAGRSHLMSSQRGFFTLTRYTNCPVISAPGLRSSSSARGGPRSCRLGAARSRSETRGRRNDLQRLHVATLTPSEASSEKQKHGGRVGVVTPRQQEVSRATAGAETSSRWYARRNFSE